MKTLLLALTILLGSTILVQAQANIHKIDFKNFTYRLSCGDADEVSSVTVKRAEYSGDKDGLDIFLRIYKIIYGDIDSNGKNEAIVLYSCGSGASYAYFRGLIFTIKNKKPVLLTEIEGGNKGDGGFHNVRVVNGLLVVERYQLSTAGSPCCPATIETAKFKLKKTRLVQVGKTASRNIPKT